MVQRSQKSFCFLLRTEDLNEKEDQIKKEGSYKVMSIEQSICESHSKEKLYDETLTVTRIKSDPNLFFRYAKKFSICTITKAIGPLLHPVTHMLTDNKTEMCTILLDQFNSVFSTPKPNMIISDPVSFFSCQSIPIGAEINYLSDIDFSESIIVESIKELSSNSAAGPDGLNYNNQMTSHVYCTLLLCIKTQAVKCDGAM